MHPGQLIQNTSSRGFLRTRGDAPLQRDFDRTIDGVPPHARRCTPPPADPTYAPQGSSARAEMHPIDGAPSVNLNRFLRTRGDAPSTVTFPAFRTSVPPHARRCTFSADLKSCQNDGSSARAEMHPKEQ